MTHSKHVCEMTHSWDDSLIWETSKHVVWCVCVWDDSLIWETSKHVCEMTHWYDVCVCEMTHWCVWDDSFVRWVIDSVWDYWLIWDDSHTLTDWYATHRDIAYTYTYDAPHSNVRHDSFKCATWLIYTCDMTCLYVWHDIFIYVTFLLHMYDMSHS